MVVPEQPLRVLGLDLSMTASGYVVLERGSRVPVHHGKVGLSLAKGSDIRKQVERLAYIAETIRGEAYAWLHPSHPVAIEGYARGAKFKREEMGELHGVVRDRLFQAGYGNLHYFPPTEVRKLVLGDGNGGLKKPEIKKVLAHCGVALPNYDIMDAWMVGMAYLGEARWLLQVPGQTLPLPEVR